MYNIEDGNGTDLSQGIESEIVARRAAQNLANERGSSVYLYVGSTSDQDDQPDTSVEAEEIAPDTNMHYTIHARSFGHQYEDIGQELDTLEAAQAEAADLWPGSSVRVEGNREWVIVHNGEKVGEIRTAHT